MTVNSTQAGEAVKDGPAFPVLELDQVTGHIHAQHMGVTVRDYFAGKALVGMMAIPSGDSPSATAAYAFHMADAMMAERNKT